MNLRPRYARVFRITESSKKYSDLILLIILLTKKSLDSKHPQKILKVRLILLLILEILKTRFRNSKLNPLKLHAWLSNSKNQSNSLVLPQPRYIFPLQIYVLETKVLHQSNKTGSFLTYKMFLEQVFSLVFAFNRKFFQLS